MVRKSTAYATSVNQAELAATDDDGKLLDERMSCPRILREMHNQWAEDDAPASASRTAVQELVDFVPPYDQGELDANNQGDRFNINFGLAASIKNEAVGAYLDIFTSPEVLADIPLLDEVDPDQRDTWQAIMAEEFTKMIRRWDRSLPLVHELADIVCTHGVAIPWFDDAHSLSFNVGGLEDMKCDPDTIAVPSMVDAFTFRKPFSPSALYAKIEGHEDAETHQGWNVAMVKKALANAGPKDLTGDSWNYEATARMVKANRLGATSRLQEIELVYGMVRELDGKISLYATTRDCAEDPKPGDSDYDRYNEEEPWLYVKRNAFKDANQAFQIFAFGIGNKNRIHTIRGLAYFLFEAGQADNILRCKLLDAARFRAAEAFQPESTIDSIEDIQFIDVGHATIVPKGLRGVQGLNPQRLDQSIGFALSSNQEVLDRHSAGLASNGLMDNPAARRNELQVSAELEHINKLQSFAISLFYAPYDKLIRELVRRAFQESQSDLVAMQLVESMREACTKRGVPEEVFDQIDLDAVTARRVMGPGSRSARITAYSQMSQLYPEMDEVGKKYFVYDWASELYSADKATRWFGKPGERRVPIDVAIAQLENSQLLEGEYLPPVEGENKMVHLQEHVEELLAGVKAVNEGQADIADWTLRNIPLYRHTVETLEGTTVHETRTSELNLVRQQVQQVGEIIDNGLRHLNKLQEEGKLQQPIPGQEGQQGQPDAEAAQKANAAQQDHEAKMGRMFAEAQAKIEIMARTNEQKMANERATTMAKIQLMDATEAAKIRRNRMLDRYSPRG